MSTILSARKLFFSFGFVLAGFMVSYGLVGQNLSAAQLASPLRQLIGNEAVANLESLLFGAQDKAKQFQYEVGLAKAEAPWSMPISPTAPEYPQPNEPLPPEPAAHPNNPWLLSDFLAPLTNNNPTPTPSAPKTVAPTDPPAVWQPRPLAPFGTLAGEGEWLAYLHDPAGTPLAYRTFLQPDPERPFAIVAIVAIDLTKTKLNFVLGTEEPRLPTSPIGSGTIPPADKTANHLLAAFNGGFMATHGQYGAMANGQEAIPPQDGLATVVIAQNGQVHIGVWGHNILASDKLIAWRQNAYMVIQNGKITPETATNSLTYWSGSLNSEVVTWRSGLGLSQDGQVLYYFAGPSLHMLSLGQAMITAGVENGMLLDINPYWVHFTAISAQDQALVATSLMDSMSQHIDRFLKTYQRDFFYLTVR